MDQMKCSQLGRKTLKAIRCIKSNKDKVRLATIRSSSLPIMYEYSIDLRMLPPLIQDQILCFLDFRSLAACCRVCKDWNRFVSKSSKAWKEACREFGLIVRDGDYRDSKYWKEYAKAVIERKIQMKKGQCFEVSDLMNSSEEISAIAYYKGRIAVAFTSPPQRIEVWNSSNIRLLSIRTDGLVSKSLKFDNSFMMSMFKGITSWDMSSGNHVSTFKGGDFHCCCFDFLTDFNIVVGGFTSSFIYIWKMSNGEEVNCMDAERGSILKVSLAPQPTYEADGRKVITLLSANEEEITLWNIKLNSWDVSSETVDVEKNIAVQPISPSWCIPLTEPKLESLRFDGKCFYYPQYSADVLYNEIFVWDVDYNFFTDQYRVNSTIKNLLAVGEKYIALHTENSGKEIFLVVDRVSREEVASFYLPRELYNIGSIENHPVIVGETSWLDGFNGENDDGIICLCVCNKKSLKYVRWGPRDENF